MKGRKKGTMVDIFQLTIPELTEDEPRTAYVYVPDTDDPNARFPVLYMFDGHNLFYDHTASFGKSWGLLTYLERTKTPLQHPGAWQDHDGLDVENL